MQPEYVNPAAAAVATAVKRKQLESEKSAMARTRMARTPMRNAIAAGLFPQPIKLHPTRCIAFDSDEIDAWIAARIAERDASRA